MVKKLKDLLNMEHIYNIKEYQNMKIKIKWNKELFHFLD